MEHHRNRKTDLQIEPMDRFEIELTDRNPLTSLSPAGGGEDKGEGAFSTPDGCDILPRFRT